MTESIKELRAIHTHACATVAKTDRRLSPEHDAFWPLYIQNVVDVLRLRSTPFTYAYQYWSQWGPVWECSNGETRNGSGPIASKALYDIPHAPAESSQAVRDVLAEQQRCVDVEGFTDEHDDEHAPGTLALAAAAYALDAGHTLDCFTPNDAEHPEPLFWPFSSDWWKPGSPRRGLIKAAALLLAEIERIDRTASATNDQEVDS